MIIIKQGAPVWTVICSRPYKLQCFPPPYMLITVYADLFQEPQPLSAIWYRYIPKCSRRHLLRFYVVAEPVVGRTDSTDRAHLPCGSPWSDVEVRQHIKNHYVSATLCKILHVGISNSNAYISASAVNHLEFIADRITCVLKMFHGMPVVFSILFAVV